MCALEDVCKPLVNPSVTLSVNPSVIVAQSCKLFSTLCEIPMGYSPSVTPLVNVAQSCKCFSTLCEIPTGDSPSVYPSVKP